MASQQNTSLPGWIQILHNENAYEDEDNANGATILLPPSGRSLVWTLTRKLLGEQTQNGLAGHACQLFERFLASLVRRDRYMRFYNLEFVRRSLQLKEKMTLYICVCIQLSVKAILVQHSVCATDLKILLESNNHYYTLQEINKTALEIFQCLDYRIPTRTNVENAQMLAVEVGMSGNVIHSIALIMDIVDHDRPDIQELINVVTFAMRFLPSTDGEAGSSSSTSFQNVGNIRNMHLQAGVVAAAFRFFKLPGPEPIPRLAVLVRSEVRYLTCICNMIISEVIDKKEETDNENAKRQRNRCINILRKKRPRQF